MANPNPWQCGLLNRLEPTVLIERPLEDRGKSVVVTLGNGVELMGMAPSTADGQTHDGRTQDLERVVNHFQTIRNKSGDSRERAIR